MRHRLTMFVAVFCFILALASANGPAFGRSPQAAAPSTAQKPSTVDRGPSPTDQGPSPMDHGQSRAVLAKYCVTCHNQRTKTAGLALDALDLANVGAHAEEWEEVVRKVRTGAMPPVGRPRPDKVASEGLVTWLETELDRAAMTKPNPGRPTLHRLNRAEYRNAIRDLLALDIDVASLLPADNAAYGFDNNADALSLSPLLT